MLAPAPPEYALIKVGKNHWKVHKFDGHHGCFLCTYDIKQSEDLGWYCTCKAGRNCKHLAMVFASLNEGRKSLF